MFSLLYGAAAVLVFLQLVFLLFRGGKQQSAYFIVLFSLTLVCNIGYFALAISKSVEAAILSNNITYFGAVFLPFFVMLTMAELCRVKISKTLIIPLLICSLVVLGFIFSIGHRSIYYKSVSIGTRYGVTYLVKDYGPLHILYPLMLLFEVSYTLAIVVRSMVYKKTFSKKTVAKLMIALLVPSFTYAFSRLLRMEVEILPFIYVAILSLYSSVESKISMYDMTSDVLGTVDRMQEYGYITFDLKKNYMNCNPMAVSIFPELETARIDANLPPSDSVLYTEIVQWLDEAFEDNHTEKELKVGDKYIKCIVRKIHNGMRRKDIGYSVELIDDTRQQNYIHLLNNYNADLEQKVEEKTARIELMQDSVITGIASVVESRDNSTGGHIRRTSQCVRILVDALLDKKYFPAASTFGNKVIKAAPMHDLGKIAVDDRILRKPGKFTAEEYAEMKKHSEEGARIVAEVLKEVDDTELLDITVNVANYHHEKWNGTGYPKGLRQKEIPLEARIMALADVFDALVSKRCYKEAYSYDKAFGIIEDSLGSHFDPELGRVFMSCRPKLEALYDAMKE